MTTIFRKTWFWPVTSTSVLSVVSCRKLEYIQSLMAAGQQCKDPGYCGFLGWMKPKPIQFPSLLSRIAWSSVSKAESLCSLLCHSPYVRLLSAVLWFFLRPHWNLSNKLFPTITSRSCLATTFSTIFESKFYIWDGSYHGELGLRVRVKFRVPVS